MSMGYIASAGAPELLSSSADSQLILQSPLQTFPTVFKKSDGNSHPTPKCTDDLVSQEIL